MPGGTAGSLHLPAVPGLSPAIRVRLRAWPGRPPSRERSSGLDRGGGPYAVRRIGRPLAYPPKMLQEIMGHASITTTLDLYGHLYPGEMDRYADQLDGAAGEADAARMRPDDQDGTPELSA
jgi:integrase